jgi:DNA-binding MarR family transcriptional regulator
MAEIDDRSELASRAWRLFLDAGRRRFEAMAHETDAMGLSRGMAQFLVAICTSPPGPTNQLAERFGIDPGWVTQIVDRLEARGDIVRRVSPDDRRVKLLEVTDAGRRTFEHIEAQFAAPPPELLEVPRDDLLAFVRIAERLAPPLDEADVPGSPTLPRR